MADNRSQLEIDIAAKLQEHYGFPATADTVAADLMPIIEDAMDQLVQNTAYEMMAGDDL